jgi:hypothetical protein
VRFSVGLETKEGGAGLRGAEIAAILVRFDFVETQDSVFGVLNEGFASVLTLVNILVNVFDALDAAGGLDIEMRAVFAEEVRVVGYDPAIVDVFIELVIAFDPRKDGPVFWSLILGITVGFDLCLFAERERVLLAAFTAELRRMHARAVGIESAAGSVKHVVSNEAVKLGVEGFIWNLTGHNFIDIFGGPRLVGSVFQDQEEVRMRQPSLLKKKEKGSV